MYASKKKAELYFTVLYCTVQYSSVVELRSSNDLYGWFTKTTIYSANKKIYWLERNAC